MKWVFLAFVSVCTAFIAPLAVAQSQYPSKPVRVIVGFPPGGSTDIMARLLAPGLSSAFKQQFVVDNRPGANSNIGNELAARSSPDGYTLVVVSASLSSNVSVYSKMSYDPVRDFAPIARIAAVHNVLVVHPSLPVKTVKELVALGKARPGQLVFASGGIGSPAHLGAELHKQTVGGLDMTHVPYNGIAPALIDLIAGNVHVLLSTMPSAMPYIKSGRLRALGVASLNRAAAFPELPTFVEGGFPGFEVAAWNAVLAPAGTSREIIARLNTEIVRIVHAADMRDKLAAQGAEPVGDTPEQFAAYLRADVEKWAKVVKASGAKGD